MKFSLTDDMSNATAAQKRYWSKVAALGCLVCGQPAEIAHAHGESIVERLQEPKAKGKKLARMNWLVLPLCDKHHRLGGPGIITVLDWDVAEWELFHGKQSDHIDRLAERFSLDLWSLARGHKQRLAA